MRAGPLNRFITVQSRSAALAADGGPAVIYTDVVRRRPAAYKPVSGDENPAAPQEVAMQRVEFIVRYSANLAGLTPLHRVIYPALTAAESGEPSARRVFDVIDVQEIGLREGLRIIAQRKADRS